MHNTILQRVKFLNLKIINLEKIKQEKSHHLLRRSAHVAYFHLPFLIFQISSPREVIKIQFLKRASDPNYDIS